PYSQPGACADGRSFSTGAVDMVDPHLRMEQVLRTSLAVDRAFPGDVLATVEAIYTKNRSDFFMENLNLRGPQGVDRYGRVMYGTLGPSGARPALVVDSLPEVMDLRNQSRNHSWSITAQLTKTFSDRLEARAAYAHTV